MVRGKGTETLNAQLEGKAYKDGVNDLIKYSAVRASDFDTKAFNLLDTLSQRDRSVEACQYLKQALEGVTRDRISNWRAYLYTLLRGFDEAAYTSMKAEKGDGRRRRADRAEREGAQGSGERKREKEEKRKLPPEGDIAAKKAILAAVGVKTIDAKATPEPSGDSKPAGESKFNAKAAEFVPGMIGPGVTTPGEKTFSSTAKEFVPGMAWTGTPSTAPASTKFSAGAAPFVPGKPTWTGEAAAGDASRRSFQPTAAEFVPGRPWPEANGAASAAQAVAPSQASRKGGGGGGPVVTLDARLWPAQGPAPSPTKAASKAKAGKNKATKGSSAAPQPEVPGPIAKTSAQAAATTTTAKAAAAAANSTNGDAARRTEEAAEPPVVVDQVKESDPASKPAPAVQDVFQNAWVRTGVVAAIATAAVVVWARRRAR